MKESEKKLSTAAPPNQATETPSDHDLQSAEDDGLAADEHIRMRAYALYRERGGKVGDDMSDWLRAEREYRESVSRTSASKPARQPTAAPTSAASRP